MAHMSSFLNPCGPLDQLGRKCGQRKTMRRITFRSTSSFGRRLAIGSLVQSFMLLKLDWPGMALAAGQHIPLIIVQGVGQLWMEVLSLKIPRYSFVVRKPPSEVWIPLVFPVQCLLARASGLEQKHCLVRLVLVGVPSSSRRRLPERQVPQQRVIPRCQRVEAKIAACPVQESHRGRCSSIRWAAHQNRQKRVMGARTAQGLHRVKSAHSEIQAQFEPRVFVGDLDGWGRSSCIVGRLFVGQRKPVAS